ncbi:MAG: hypothetical protein ABI728_11375, partial [Betaproteobacteria bacterium]
LKALADAKRAAAVKPSTLSGSATWQQSPMGGQNTSPSGSKTTPLNLIWIGSAVLVVAAVVLFLLR